jgi:hypothetical protein
MLVLQFVYRCNPLSSNLRYPTFMVISHRHDSHSPGSPPATFNLRQAFNTEERSCSRTSRFAVGKYGIYISWAKH